MQVETLIQTEDTQGKWENGVLEQKLNIRYVKQFDSLMVTGSSTGLEVLPAYIRLLDQARNHFTFSDKLICYFRYSVINASTTKLLMNLFGFLSKAARIGNKVEVFWVVEEEDEDLIAVGSDLKNLYNLKFDITIK